MKVDTLQVLYDSDVNQLEKQDTVLEELGGGTSITKVEVTLVNKPTKKKFISVLEISTL